VPSAALRRHGRAASQALSTSALLWQVDRFFSKLHRSCRDDAKENTEDGQGRARRPSANGPPPPPPAMLPMSVLQLRGG